MAQWINLQNAIETSFATFTRITDSIFLGWQSIVKISAFCQRIKFHFEIFINDCACQEAIGFVFTPHFNRRNFNFILLFYYFFPHFRIEQNKNKISCCQWILLNFTLYFLPNLDGNLQVLWIETTFGFYMVNVSICLVISKVTLKGCVLIQ